MVRNKGQKLEQWEVALIKSMWASNQFTKQQIHPYFTRPDRPINQARISQIADKKIYASIEPANDRQLQAFLKQPADQQAAKRRFLDEDPWHPNNLEELFKRNPNDASRLALGETDRFECKKSFSWGSRGEYVRTMAGFANNRGGYLLFGVLNDTKEVVGIENGRLDQVDNAKISSFMNQKLLPSVRWDKRELQFGQKVIGAIYAWPARTKPVICAQDHQSELKEGDIYFRYVGQTSRIRFAELAQSLVDRDRQLEERWMEVFSKVAKAGAANVAVLDTNTGELSGPQGSYIISEALLPSIKFLREGEFEEKAGSPTVKLVGTAHAIALPPTRITNTVIERAPISDWEVLDTFLGQKQVTDPAGYIRHLANAESMWLPVYYFIRQAGLSLDAAIVLLKKEHTKSQFRRDRQLDRLKNGRTPPQPSVKSYRDIHEVLVANGKVDLSTLDRSKNFLKGVRTLSAEELNLDYLLPMVKSCFDQFYGQEMPVSTEIRYASSYIDTLRFRVE